MVTKQTWTTHLNQSPRRLQQASSYCTLLGLNLVSAQTNIVRGHSCDCKGYKSVDARYKHVSTLALFIHTNWRSWFGKLTKCAHMNPSNHAAAISLRHCAHKIQKASSAKTGTGGGWAAEGWSWLTDPVTSVWTQHAGAKHKQLQQHYEWKQIIKPYYDLFALYVTAL